MLPPLSRRYSSDHLREGRWASSLHGLPVDQLEVLYNRALAIHDKHRSVTHKHCVCGCVCAVDLSLHSYISFLFFSIYHWWNDTDWIDHNYVFDNKDYVIYNHLHYQTQRFHSTCRVLGSALQLARVATLLRIALIWLYFLSLIGCSKQAMQRKFLWLDLHCSF